MSTTTTTKNTTIKVPDGDSEKKGDDQDMKVPDGDSEKKGDDQVKDVTAGVSALALTPPSTPVMVKLEKPELCEDGDEDGDKYGDPVEETLDHELGFFQQINNDENVAVIWEVTFLEVENILSSVATMWAYNHELNPPTQDNFKQSIRNGLKKIVHPIGFTMANSRSVYIGKKDVVEDSLFKKSLDGPFNTKLVTYLLSFVGRVDVDINVRRASRWLSGVFQYQHNCPTSSPGITPETRNQCTPLLFIKCSRMY